MTTRTCTQCRIEKEATRENYYAYKRAPDGCKAVCKVCLKKAAQSPEGKASQAKRAATYYNTEKGKEASARSKEEYYGTEKQKETYKKYKTTHALTEKGRAGLAKRMARYQKTEKGRATQAVNGAVRRDKEKCELTAAEKESVKALYLECRRLNEEAGTIERGLTSYHVDHIKPVAKGGKTHPDNLQILTATENLRKSDKY